MANERARYLMHTVLIRADGRVIYQAYSPSYMRVEHNISSWYEDVDHAVISTSLPRGYFDYIDPRHEGIIGGI